MSARLSLSVMASVVFVQMAAADTLFLHVGATDPATEDFSHITGNGSVAYGPVFGDPPYGVDAWYCRDLSSIGGSWNWYDAQLSSAQVLAATTRGWKFSTLMRVVEPSDVPDFALFLQVFANGRGYSTVFGSQHDGDPIVQFVTDFSNQPPLGPLSELDGAGPGYHLYEWTYDPITQSTSMAVDGIVRLTGYDGYLGAGSYVAWGAGGSVAVGWGNFSRVEFKIGCLGDTNGDWQVNLNDLTNLLSNFGRSSGATRELGNLDGDGDVDLTDLTLLLADFGRLC